MDLLDAFVSASHIRFIGSTVYDHLVEPCIVKYIDHIDVESKMKKGYNADDYTKEELDRYESAGNDISKFAKSVSMYGMDIAKPDSVRGALFRMIGTIGMYAEEDPAAAGHCIIDGQLGSNQLLDVAQYVNNKISQCEASGEKITPDKISSWSKKGLGMSAMKTVSDIGNEAKDEQPTYKDTTDEDNKSMSKAERDALADWLVSDIELPDTGTVFEGVGE